MALSDARLARMRLAAQRLAPETAASDAADAARAVLGIQAQDVRAAALALRARVPGIERPSIDADPRLLRTWTFRGTVHLIDAADLPWIHALTGARNASRYEALLENRGDLGAARNLLPDIAELLAREPLSRADLLRCLAERGRPSLGERGVNVLMPWLAAHSVVAGLPDGRFRAAEPPPPVDEDEALAILGRRYLDGYGPAGPEDLARFSGLPLSAARRALASVADAEPVGPLLALPTAHDAPPAPTAILLGAYDTAMLGWRTREPLVDAGDDRRVLPGGGVVRPVVLGRGRAVATWKLSGSGARRRVELDPFRRLPPARSIAAEAADVGRFLGFEASVAA